MTAGYFVAGGIEGAGFEGFAGGYFFATFPPICIRASENIVLRCGFRLTLWRSFLNIFFNF